MKKYFCALFALMLLSAASIAAASEGELPIGESVYYMAESTGATDAPISVYCYRSESWAPGRPIVFVFHGMNRNAEEYRESWEDFADADGLLIVCPEFTDEKYPGSRYYNTGNIYDESLRDSLHTEAANSLRSQAASIMDKTNGRGYLQPKEDWVFPVVDRVIRDVKERMGAASSPVAVFGHSAGAQMVHRYALFGGSSEASLIMPANAGWYTFPTLGVPFPYGLNGVPFSEADMAAAFAKPVVILLGEADTERTDNLRQTPEADAQGYNRFERGQHFYYKARSEAARLDVPFNWRMVTVPGIGHNGAAMAKAALSVIEQMFLE